MENIILTLSHEIKVISIDVSYERKETAFDLTAI